MFWKRLAVWLALPVAVLAALALGHHVFRPEFAVEANEFEELLGVTPTPRPEEVALRVWRADGEPAEGAVVVMLEPEVSIDYADAEGWARLQRSVGGPVRLQAYAPGHELVTVGPIPTPELGEIRFEARVQPVIPELAPEKLVRHDVQLIGRGGEPIPAVQVVARRPIENFDNVRPMIEPGVEPSRFLVPWVAFSDEQGWVQLDGLPELSVQLRAYPLGLPRNEAWELDSMRLTPRPEGESEWRLEVASLELSGMPAETALQMERTDVAGQLPLRRVPPSGMLRWMALPPGNYQLQIGETTRLIELFAGENQVSWN